MNFDDDDDSDFGFNPQPTNSKLASLFKSGLEDSSDETLKYKAPKQPHQATQISSNPGTINTAQQSTSVLFFSGIQAFKYVNNRYEPQGKLGLAVLSNSVNSQNQYRILLYVTRTQPVATIRLSPEFKISIQKNNYVSFYDESRQIWSILFDTEELVANFAIQIALCKCNLVQGNLENHKLHQDLKLHENDTNLVLDQNDSVEVGTIVSVWKDTKLVEIENTNQKPFKLKLGKNKLPQVIEDLVIKMKQGDRKLFIVNGSAIKSFYPNSLNNNSIVFYDINILRIKKNTGKEERSNSSASSIDQMPPLPQLSQITPQQVNQSSDQESRSRSESVREKTKLINEQINDPKLEKAKVISRMAKLGMQMLPNGVNNTSNMEIEDEWTGLNQTTDTNTSIQHNFSHQAQTSYIQDNQSQTTNQALLMQNQQLQQQLALQNQLAQAQAQSQAQLSTNQLALYKSPTQYSNQPIYMYPGQQQQQQQQPAQQAQTTQTLDISPALQTKLELLSEKLDQIKSITNLNNQNMPTMETSVLLQNIQRIVKENEQYKKDLYDKSSKIEEQNSKITDLLIKAQNYVEQNHQILELKNNSYQSTAEKSQYRILELEQDKMKLTNDLTQLTGQISELNLELNKVKKDDLEMRKQLSDVSKNTDQHKQNSDRLLIENADLQTKLDAVLAELKKERHLRKTNETKLQLNEDELNELRSSLVNSQKLNEEKKRKQELDRVQFESEVEDLKRLHLNELNLLKEKLNKAKTNANESKSEQLKQLEADLNHEWQSKLEKLIQQNEQKYERQIHELTQEVSNSLKQLEDSIESAKHLRQSLLISQTDNDKLKLNLEDLKQFKDKYERLQSQALIMKERYENRIKELLDAEPDSEVIGEEVKKLMNAMYRKLKSQIRPDQYYSGNGILIAMLRIIKMITLQLLSSKSDNSLDNSTEEEDIDYFSQHIYQAPEVVIRKEVIVQSPSFLSSPSQVEATQESDHNQSHAVVAEQGIDQVDEVKTELKQEETNTEKVDNFDDEDDGIQLINEDEGEKNEFMVNETLSQPEVQDETVPDKVDEGEQVVEQNENERQSEQLTDDVLNESDENIVVINNDDFEREETSVPETPIPHTETKVKEDEDKQVEIKKTIISKGLFDDEEEDGEDEELFSFASKTNQTKNNDSNQAEFNNELSLKAEQPAEESKTNPTSGNLNSLMSTIPPQILKFSPPPLFDDDDDGNSSEKDIDWFK